MKQILKIIIFFIIILFLFWIPRVGSADLGDSIPDSRPFNDQTFLIQGTNILKTGVVSGRFGDPRNHVQGGYQYPHQGVDYRLPTGEQVWAAGSGVIKFAGWKSGYGWVIFIDHQNGYETRYAHLSKQWAIQGKEISKRALIAEVGDTGNARGPHLHFEIWHNGKPINPAQLILK